MAAPRLLSIRQAAEHMSCSRRHVYDLIAAGHLAIVAIGVVGAEARITEAELARFINSRTSRSSTRTARPV